MLIKKTVLILIILILIIPLYGFSPTSTLDNNLKKTTNLIELEAILKTENPNSFIDHIEDDNFINNEYFCFNQTILNKTLLNYKETILTQIYTGFDTNNHITVSNLLESYQKYFKIDNSIKSIITITNQKNTENESVIYNGKIEHLTFQTLMAFPDKALSTNNNLSGIYDEEKLTKNEFEAILHELYKNNYILVDIYDIIDANTFSLKQLKLPPNKKPIILSFDNVSYKSNYQNIGEIDKIIIDRNNNLATYTTKKSIQDRIQYNNEFVVILERFIQNYPDFSHNDARGIIFLSGENGILGYNTNHKNASHKTESKRASEVVKKLKLLGWRFGCNNYTYTNETTKSEMDFAKELSLWNKEIKTIIGNTPLYAHPYGVDCNNSMKDLLLADNFKIFFINDYNTDIKQTTNIYTIGRKEINGFTLRNQKDNLAHLFDCEKIYDHANRNIPYYN